MNNLNWQFFIFPIAAFLAFFVPGDLFIKPLKLSLLPRIVLACILGLVLWALAGVIFGFVQMRWLLYVYIALLLVIWLRINLGSVNKLRYISLKHFPFVDFVLVLIAVITSLSAVWFIGIYDMSGNLYFCCRGVPDAIYHLALTNQIYKAFPPHEPGLATATVKNYHFLSNLIVADLARVFRFDIVSTQFRYMSIFVSILLAASPYLLANLLKLSKTFARWFLLFLFGSGDIIYILLLLRGKGLNLDVTILDDATKLLAGPPRAFSILIFIGGVGLMLIWLRRRDIYSGLLVATVMGSLIGFKVYTGIFALIGLCFIGLMFILKKELKMLLPILVAVVLSASLYLPFNSTAGGLHFDGLWKFENFMANKDLGLFNLELLRLSLVNDKKLLQVGILEIMFIITYFLTLYGTANLALFQSRKSLSLLPKELNLFLISAIVTTLFIGSLFTQTTGGANTVQFIIGDFIFAGIYAALVCYYWQKKLRLPIAFALGIMIVLLTSARAIHEDAQNFYWILNQVGFKIPPAELKALSYLKTMTPIDSKIMLSSWMSEEEIYIYTSFLADRPLFLGSAGVLRDHGYSTSQSANSISTILKSTDEISVKNELKSNGINYLLLPIEVFPDIGGDNLLMTTVYSTDMFKVIKVNDLK